MMMVNKIITVGFLAAVMASMVFMAGGLKTTLAQPNPAIPGLESRIQQQCNIRNNPKYENEYVHLRHNK